MSSKANWQVERVAWQILFSQVWKLSDITCLVVIAD